MESDLNNREDFDSNYLTYQELHPWSSFRMVYTLKYTVEWSGSDSSRVWHISGDTTRTGTWPSWRAHGTQCVHFCNYERYFALHLVITQLGASCQIIYIYITLCVVTTCMHALTTMVIKKWIYHDSDTPRIGSTLIYSCISLFIYYTAMLGRDYLSR